MREKGKKALSYSRKPQDKWRRKIGRHTLGKHLHLPTPES